MADYETFYSTYLRNLTKNGTQRRATCPFCDHKNDFSVNVVTGQVKCFYGGCLFEGDAFDFLMKLKDFSFSEAKTELAKYGIFPLKDNPVQRKREEEKEKSPLPEAQIQAYTQNLSDNHIQFLRKLRGLSTDVIKRYKIGWHKEKGRFTIPVPWQGKYTNVRLYHSDKQPKILPISSGRSIQLYPEDRLDKDELWLCEGELDALCAISHGLAAVTVTGGAGSWKGEFTPLFKNKKIRIVYDCDDGGRKGAERIAQTLGGVAEVKVIDLGLKEGEDLTDWFVTHGKSKQELEDLASRTSIVKTSAPKGKRKIGQKEETRTLIPGLIHLIEEGGIVKYLIKKDGNLEIQESLLLDGVLYKPKQNLPIKMPVPDILIEPIEIDWDDLLNEVVEFVRSYLEMPSESDYLILTLWIFHTYLIENFSATPILYFYGVKETGKTRAGEVLGELAFRCERLTSPTEATLFRSADYFKTSLIIDEIKLWGQDGNQEVARLIKSRYKRGLMVSRVNLNKTGEDQIEYYDVFAPLVICSTESLPDTIESRCITFLMHKNSKVEVEKLINEEWANKLRNKLTIFRANYLNHGLPETEQIATRRLNEIMQPLYQILMLVASERKEEFKVVLEEMERTKEEEEGLSLEAEIVEEIIKYEKETGERVFLTTEIADRLNKERSERENLSDRLVSFRIKRLGFEKTRLAGGKRGFKINSELLKKLAFQFGIDL